MTCIFGDKSVRKRKRLVRRSLLLLSAVAELDATVAAHLRDIAGWLCVLIAATARREDFVVILWSTNLRGEVARILIVDVLVVVAIVFVALLIFGAGIELAVSKRHLGALVRVTMSASRSASRISINAGGAPKQVLNSGVHALVEGAGESSLVTNIATTVADLLADVSGFALAVLGNRAKNLAMLVDYGCDQVRFDGRAMSLVRPVVGVVRCFWARWRALSR